MVFVSYGFFKKSINKRLKVGWIFNDCYFESFKPGIIFIIPERGILFIVDHTLLTNILKNQGIL